jgi:hypothetical protein
MAEQPPSSLRNPQIVAAIIGAVATLLVAVITVIPTIINSSQTPTPIVVTATVAPTIQQPTLNSENSQPIQPSTVVPQPTEISEPPNVRVFYDGVSFTLLNESGNTLSLEGVSFRSDAGTWDARNWGPSIYDRLPDGQCLRLRDRGAGQRQPPPSCVNKIFSLIEVGSTALFWVNIDNFEVVHSGEVIATCATVGGECGIHIPRS